MSAIDFNLAKLLYPLQAEAFFRDCWEKRPQVISRGEPDYYAGLLSLRDVDDLIAFTRPKFLEPSAFRPGGAKSQSFVQGFLAEADPFPLTVYPHVTEVHQAFTQGKTVIITALQHRKAAVARLCRDLESFFECSVHANMYLTPPGAQGFDPHFDSHEVFVLQVHGSKHWRLYGPAVDLPLEDEHGGSLPRDRIGPVTQEVFLNAGDLLYLPRGHVHEAFTSKELSLHLTVGIKVFRWVDLLHQAVSDLANKEVCFRESLPPGLLTGPLSASARAQFHKLLHVLGQNARLEEAIESLAASFLGRLAPLPNNYFADQTDTEDIGPDTLLEKTPGMIYRLEESDGQVSLTVPGNRLDGPAKIAAALHFVTRTPRFAVRSLPDDLSESGKLVLARRLVRDKFLIVVANGDAQHT